MSVTRGTGVVLAVVIVGVTHCRSWCSLALHPRVLYLHGNKLSGTIPSSLGFSNTLSHLWLSENRLTGDFPAQVAVLVRTRILSTMVCDTDLNGVVPSTLLASGAFDKCVCVRASPCSSTYRPPLPFPNLSNTHPSRLSIPVSLSCPSDCRCCYRAWWFSIGQCVLDCVAGTVCISADVFSPRGAPCPAGFYCALNTFGTAYLACINPPGSVIARLFCTVDAHLISICRAAVSDRTAPQCPRRRLASVRHRVPLSRLFGVVLLARAC